MFFIGFIILITLDNENARLTATVDFPTPPLQLDTAMILFTFCKP